LEVLQDRRVFTNLNNLKLPTPVKNLINKHFQVCGNQSWKQYHFLMGKFIEEDFFVVGFGDE
jgi:hypothetical protein